METASLVTGELAKLERVETVKYIMHEFVTICGLNSDISRRRGCAQYPRGPSLFPSDC